MPPQKPEFRIPLAMLIIPTLEVMSLAMAKEQRTKYYKFASEYSCTLSKHLAIETEVTIANGALTEGCEVILQQMESDFGILQYKNHIHSLADPWKVKLDGQPNHRGTSDSIENSVEAIIKEFENFIYKLQHETTKEMRAKNKKLCFKACNSQSKILNLTEFEVPSELEKVLSCGPNYVPMEELSCSELTGYIEKDLIMAAINFYRDENKVYPLVNHTAGLKIVLEQLLSQSPSNSSQLEFYTSMYYHYIDHKQHFYDQLAEGHYMSRQESRKLVPLGTILTTTDKGLGPCLLPVEWFVKQYEIQAEKGCHVQTGMSSDQCINFLKLAIQSFRSALTAEERNFLKQYFVDCNPTHRVGVLKIIPKVHKITQFGSEAWKELPSRPIRGAENCPINPYSKTLCKMLQEMHSTLKAVLLKKKIGFPVIYGCDEYSDNIQKVKFDRLTWSNKTLISGDFSDAYTKSNLCDLQGSIGKLGVLAKWSEYKINLAKKLAGLVFEIGFFETPGGILKQTQGFPMGGHNTREGLDNILLSREVDLLISPISKNLLFYYRLVDDISLAFDGSFEDIRSLLKTMASFYPHAMPLNIQISFGYSHFLDSHIFNFLQKQETNSFTTSLSYKPLSKFDYVPFNSNVGHSYKGNTILVIVFFTYVFF